jgi:hypothetical protein
MKHRLVYLALAVVVVVTLSSTAALACAAPSAPGVNICTPGNTQAVAYPAQITAAATAPAGRTITAIAVYANSSRILLQNGPGEVSYSATSLTPGNYQLNVNAWDNTGAVYTSHVAFTVMGSPTTGCTPPAAGILFCAPDNGSLQPTNNVAASVGARGANGSAITRMQVFIDGSLMDDDAINHLDFTAGFGNAGSHTLSAKAWDAAGNTYSAATTFKTYFDGVCSPKGCAPGVFVQSPADGDTVGTTFSLRADVENTTATITAMKAYLDGTQVAASSGPTMIANVDASAGTHQLIIQAWDTQGRLYRTVESITVQ